MAIKIWISKEVVITGTVWDDKLKIDYAGAIVEVHVVKINVTDIVSRNQPINDGSGYYSNYVDNASKVNDVGILTAEKSFEIVGRL